MVLKKILLVALIGIVPAQSLALNYNEKLGLACFGIYAGLMASVGGYIYYKTYQREKAEREFWQSKTNDEMTALAIKFMNKIEKRLATQLKKLRRSNFEEDDCIVIRVNLKGYHFIDRAIDKFDSWLTRLEERSLSKIASQVEELKIELIQLYNMLEIYMDKDFIREFEKLKKQTPVFIPVNMPCHYHY